MKRVLPRARVERMDTDAMSKKNRSREILREFRAGRIDVLVGTQMIGKGLDFPNVTLVGLVDADLSLHVPDFRANERTFQLLVQVAGRAGRGDRAGEVVVQTFTPQAEPIQFSRHADFAGFAAAELTQRKAFGYPPYRHLIQHQFRGRNVLIAGGGDSALDWTLNLAPIARKLTLVHHRDGFRASQHSVNQMRELVEQKKIQFHVASVKELHGANGNLEAVTLTGADKKEWRHTANAFLPFFGPAVPSGMSMPCLPIPGFGLPTAIMIAMAGAPFRRMSAFRAGGLPAFFTFSSTASIPRCSFDAFFMRYHPPGSCAA